MFTIGVDFGTLAARALVVEVESGRELASAAMNYPHAVMTDALPDGTPLPADWALQHPQDYLDCLRHIVHEAVRMARIDPKDVIGLGVDFTASTTFPVDQDAEPLCLKEAFSSNPYAWVMLWKHHAAQKEADVINALAKETNAKWLNSYGGTISITNPGQTTTRT